MSGGALNYQYQVIQNLAQDIEPTTDKRIMFKKLLYLVAQACHDIEWVDSGDYTQGEEDKAIENVVKYCKDLK